MNRNVLSLPLAAALAAFVTLSSTRADAGTIVDDFESPQAPAPWTFSNGAEFPGATGSMETAPGHPGSALRINYDFSGGGAYVAATRDLNPPQSVAALRFSARLPAHAVLGIRARDATGQWLQYKVARALAPLDENAWFTTVVELGASNSHFGGADDGVVHPPFDSISFTVSATQFQKQGSVLIDNVEALDSLVVALDPNNVTLAAPPAGVTNLMDGLGVAIHSTSDAQGLDAARSAGLTWVRTDLFWSSVEKQQGVYDFSEWDGLLDLLDARGMKALFILCYGNDLYGGGPPTSPQATAAYAAYAKAAAEHYAGRGVRFEIWNEPDNAFWTPTDPIAYSAVAAVAIDAVHEGDPGALVSTGGISWFDFDFLSAELGAGAAASADAVGVHPYRGTAPPESLPDHVLPARALITGAVATSPPLWATEWGYTATQFGAGDSPDARKRQAVMAVREMMALRMVGFPMGIWYDLRDDGPDPNAGEHNFGLIAQDGSDKPAIVALRALAKAAEGRTLTGLLDVAQPLGNGIRLDGMNDTVFILWSATPDLDVQVTVPEPESASDMFGAPLPLATSYALKESDGPIYLSFPRVGPPPTGAGGATGAGGTTGAGAGAGAGGLPGNRPDDGATAGGCGCHFEADTDRVALLPLAMALLALRLVLRQRRPKPTSFTHE